MDNIYHQYWQQELMYQLASADRYRKRAYICISALHVLL